MADAVTESPSDERTLSAETAEEDEEVSAIAERSIDAGDVRLHRSLRALVATGLVGGADVSLGIGALWLVKDKTGSDVAAALAFSIGFIALTLAHSELFTENFLLPLMAVAAKRDRPRSILRLWGTVGLANLVGGWVVIGLFTVGFPELRPVALQSASRYSRLGIGRQGLALAILGGAVITLMTWMEQRSESELGRLAGAVIAAFMLGAGALNHAIVVSLEMFGALQYGAPFGYASWLGALGWATLGNMIGGMGLVTMLRLMQIGPVKLRAERKLSESRAGSVDGGRGRGRP